MEQNKTAKVQCGGSAFILFLVFLILKLTNVITWSWWWVTAPLWIPFSIAIILALIIFIIAAIARSKSNNKLLSFKDALKRFINETN